jgi:hypothetical protein
MKGKCDGTDSRTNQQVQQGQRLRPVRLPGQVRSTMGEELPAAGSHRARVVVVRGAGRLGWYPATGAPRWVHSAGQARRELAAYRRRDTQGCVAGSWTTGAWLTEWLAGHRAVRDSTLRSYASHLRLYLLPALGRIPLDELGIQDVQMMFEQIISDHFRAGRPIAAGTLVRVRATLLAGLKAAMRRGLIATNPAALVELPAHPRAIR